MNLPSNVEFMKVNLDGSCEVKFSKKPNFMYISFDRKDNGNHLLELVYLNGDWIRHWQSIELESYATEVPSVKIEFNPINSNS
jgi:hypothetical protein